MTLPPGAAAAIAGQGARPAAARLIVLHIGPHKTATTFIQTMAEANRPRLPPGLEVIPRGQPDLARLARLVHGLRRPAEARALAPALGRAAARLERLTRDAARTLVSHEDLAGALPARHGIRGLYPFAELVLPAIVAGLGSGGARVEVVLYRRAFGDWLGSIHRQKGHRQKGRPAAAAFAPRRFAAAHGLPFNWQGYHTRLGRVLPEGCLQVLSFEEERDAGLPGRGLWLRLGLDDAAIAALERVAPQNVRRSATLGPAAAKGAGPAGRDT
jgi:hypothetical protein